MLDRLLRLYGSRAERILQDARSLEDLGEHFGADLYAAELRYLFESEWARTGEDVLYRRTRLGLRLDEAQKQSVDRFMTDLGQTTGAATLN